MYYPLGLCTIKHLSLLRGTFVRFVCPIRLDSSLFCVFLEGSQAEHISINLQIK